jgi:RHS repeat-associated protein
LCKFCCPSAHAEASCWNDSRLRQTPGGGGDPGDPTGKGPKGDPGGEGGGEEGGGDGGEDPATTEDDINLCNGNFDFVERDLYIPGRGLPLEITRTYNSQDPYDGPFGWGWSFNYDVRLPKREELPTAASAISPPPPGTAAPGFPILVRRGNGALQRFTLRSGGGMYQYVDCDPPPGCHDKLRILLLGSPVRTLVRRTDTVYMYDTVMPLTLCFMPLFHCLTGKNGMEWTFDTNGQLVWMQNKRADMLWFHSDAQRRLDKVGDWSAGRALTFTYGANNKIAEIRDPANRVFRYAYDGANNLTGYTDALGSTTTYTYDGQHRLLTVTLPNGVLWLSNTYDDKNRVVSQTYAGGTKTISYGGTEDTPAARVTDRNGHITDYTLNAKGLPTQIEWQETPSPGGDVGPVMSRIRRTYDADNNRTSETDPLGRITRYEYDGMGNLLKVIPPTDEPGNPDKFVTRYTYEPNFNQVSSVTDAKGRTTRFEYDTYGRLTRTIPASDDAGQPNKFATTYRYPSWGSRDMTNAVDAIGNVTTYEYDQFGYVNRIRYPAVGDQVAERTMQYDSIGNLLQSTDPNGNTTTYSYDLAKRVTSITDSLGNVTRFAYDSTGNRTNVVNAAGNVTSYGYDDYGKLISVTDPLGNTTTYTYDNEGNRLTTTDPEGNVTANAYDAAGRLISATDAMGNITRYDYTPNGRLSRITDAKGNATTYSYDGVNRLVRTTYPDNSYEQLTYDAVGNLIAKRTRNGDTIQYAYDTLNRLTRKTYPDATGVAYQYDALGRMTLATNVNSLIQYTYDARSRVTSSVENGKTVAYEYDAAGNRSKLIYPDATFVTYNYDQLNRLRGIRDEGGTNVAVFAYDALGRRTQLDLANGTRAAYTYDNASRLLNLVNSVASNSAVISSFGYAYDRAGNRRAMITPQGTHAYSYDRTYQLTAVDYPDGYPFPDTTYNYDAVGNRTSVVTTNGTETYAVNNLNQYTSVAGQDYAYDGNGNLTSDRVKGLAYDFDNRLVAATNGSTVTVYKYDALGRRIAEDVGGAVLAFVYDGDRIVGEYDGAGNMARTAIYGAGIDEALRLDAGSTHHYYHGDALCSVWQMSDQTGSVAGETKYDVFGVTQGGIVSTAGNRLGFTGREWDQETLLYAYRMRSYASFLGRFQQPDPMGIQGSFSLYVYCDNNPLRFVDPFGLSKEASGDDEWWKKFWEEFWKGVDQDMREGSLPVQMLDALPFHIPSLLEDMMAQPTTQGQWLKFAEKMGPKVATSVATDFMKWLHTTGQFARTPNSLAGMTRWTKNWQQEGRSLKDFKDFKDFLTIVDVIEHRRTKWRW